MVLRPDALAAARRARDEQVRHRREIGDHRVARRVLAEGQGQPALGLDELGGDEDLAQVHRRGLRVRHFHGHRAAPGNRPDDAHGRRLHGQRQVVGEVHHLADLDARRRLELVRGDDGPRARLHDVPVHAEVLELALQRAGIGLELLARALELGGGRRRRAGPPPGAGRPGRRPCRSRRSPARRGPCRRASISAWSAPSRRAAAARRPRRHRRPGATRRAAPRRRAADRPAPRTAHGPRGRAHATDPHPEGARQHRIRDPRDEEHPERHEGEQDDPRARSRPP